MARYTKDHYIEPHDDTAYVELDDDPTGNKWTRDIAMIYYLAKDWKETMGGNLADLTGDETYVPEFNSLVAFRVPRMHEVTPCTPLATRRFSIFGWFLSPDEYPHVLRKAKKLEKIAAANKAIRIGSDDDDGDGDGDGDDDAGATSKKAKRRRQHSADNRNRHSKKAKKKKA